MPAIWCRSSTRWCAGSGPGPAGDADGSGVRVLPAVVLPGGRRGGARGLAGLVPARPGPRRAHKLTDEVVAFARQLRAGDPSVHGAGWPRRSRSGSGSGCTRARWNGRWPAPPPPKAAESSGDIAGPGDDVDGYEQLRAQALAGDAGGWRLGLGVLQHRGVAAWLPPGTPCPPRHRPAAWPAGPAGARHAATSWSGCWPRWRCRAWPQGVSGGERRRGEGDRRAPGPQRLPVCAPVHAAAGADQHRVHRPAVRAAAARCALGWPAEQIITIDTDQGQSGASAADREGFQHLVAEVGMGRAGIVLGLEVSRLARNNADWHRLLEICALSSTLICDEDGLYDPAEFNDRLLLGLKGTMSEAELHFIRARLIGGQLSKARRGELQMGLPVGLVYDGAGNVVLDPDTGVQHAIRHLFAVFARAGSARAVVPVQQRRLLFPVRVRTGARKGELAWMPLTHWRVLRTLHNPRYAGAFAYGRRTEATAANGKKTYQVLPRDQWTALFPGAHPGYITWETYEANQQLLLGNAAARGTDRAAGRPAKGPRCCRAWRSAVNAAGG